MNSDSVLIAANQWLLLGAFAGYLSAALLFVSGALGTRFSAGVKFTRNASWAANAHLAGVIFHALGILARWQGAGHWPTSNMYEFIGFMAFTVGVAFQVIHRMYAMPVVGGLVSPLGVFLMAYSYVFPPKVTPLVPALKSYWMPLHVSMAALGEGFFAVAFGAALIYLLRVRGLELAEEDRTRAEVAATSTGAMAGASPAAGALVEPATPFERKWGRRGMEVLFYAVFVMVGFTLLALILRYAGFQWLFDNATYHLPPIIGPLGAAIGSKGNLFGFIPMPLFEAPTWMRGKHMNTMLYSLVVGYLLYAMARKFWTKGPIGDYLARRVSGDPEMLDEISYRAVAIGYPIFTLGGLVFAMLWAKEAWGDYWFWDPKETWALISWLFYSAYLHMRISLGWGGRKSSWMAVLGFGVILFTLIGVNLLIVGVHSYAGGDM